MHMCASHLENTYRYIPCQRDIRPVISRGRGQCLSGAEEVPRANPRTATATESERSRVRDERRRRLVVQQQVGHLADVEGWWEGTT